MADVVIRGESFARFEALRDILGHEAGLERQLQAVLGLVVVRLHRRGFPRAIHAFPLPSGPGMGGFGEAVLEATRLADARQALLQGGAIALAVGALQAVIGAPGDVLLREVSHRVRNNLQVISSLLSLQVEAIEDPRLGTLFQESQDRLHAMALVHDLLQQTDDVARINLAQYAARLTEELPCTYAIDAARITLETELEDVWVGLDTATPCGLLLHELLTNCFKHAFPEGRTGRVRVALHATAEQSLMLRVGDSGCGFPDDLDFQTTDSLGLQLVRTMADQLQGTIVLERVEGTQVTIMFPLVSPPARS